MDRIAVLEDLKLWLQGVIDFGDELTPFEVLEKLAELEENYVIDPDVCPGCGGSLNEDGCFVSYDHIWCDVKGMGIEANLEFYK